MDHGSETDILDSARPRRHNLLQSRNGERGQLLVDLFLGMSRDPGQLPGN